MSGLFLAGGVFAVAWHLVAAADATAYHAARACGGSGGQQCVLSESALVQDRTHDVSRSGTHYRLQLLVEKGTVHNVEVVGSQRSAVWDGAKPGTTVTVLTWKRGVMEVDIPDGPRAITADNPDAVGRTAAVLAVLSLGMAAVFGIGQIVTIRRMRRPRPPKRDEALDTGPAPDAIGAPAIFAETSRTYRTVPSAASAVLRVLIIDGLVALLAYRFDSGLLVALGVGGAMTVPAVFYVRWLSGFSLQLSDDGVTYSDHRRETKVPWGYARLEVRRGALMLRLDTPERVRDVSLRAFTMYNRDNAGLIPDLQRHIARVPDELTHQRTAPVSVGNGIRLLAWLIDLLPVFAVWMVLLMASLGIAEVVRHASVDQATTVPFTFATGYLAACLYAVVSWRLGGTLGMRLLRLRLVSAQTGGRPRWGQVWRRFLVALPSILVIFPLGLLVGADPPWHDRFARTALVPSRRRSEIPAAA